MKKKWNGYRVFTVFNNIFMFFIVLITAYPIYYVLIASVSDPAALSRQTGLLWKPLQPLTLNAYKMVLENKLILSGFRNTFFVLAMGLLINLTMTMLGAFFLSLKGPMFKNAVAMMIVFTMYFSGGLIPEYLNIMELGLGNSLWSLILPVAVNTTNLIIMKSAFEAIPDSLSESARLDGASYLQVLVKIMVPLSKATIAVLVLYYAVAHWNSWFSASIYLRDSSLYPLQLVLRNILTSLEDNTKKSSFAGVGYDEMARVAELMKYALIVVATTPILIFYPFLQKFFVKGVMIGAVKG